MLLKHCRDCPEAFGVVQGWCGCPQLRSYFAAVLRICLTIVLIMSSIFILSQSAYNIAVVFMHKNESSHNCEFVSLKYLDYFLLNECLLLNFERLKCHLGFTDKALMPVVYDT